MAVRSILDVDLSSLDKFTASFNKYIEQLGKTPKIWSEVGGAAKQTSVTLENMSAALLAQAEFAHGLNVAQNKERKEELAHERVMLDVEKKKKQAEQEAIKAAREQAQYWKNIGTSTKSVAVNIVDATRSILRWASIAGIISGITGAGGLFGIDRLAANAGNARRSALGLGTTVGEEKAFSLNFARLLNPGQFLGGVNEALHDVTKRSALYAAGLSENDLRGKDTTEVAAELIPALKKLADQTPATMLAQVLQARHLDQFITLEDFQRLKTLSAGEIGEYLRNYRGDVATLNLTGPQQKAWQDLQVQLQRAGESIETTFIRGLTPLAPEIGHLSDAVVKLVNDLFSSNTVKQWIDSLGEGVKWLDTEIRDPAFKKGLEDFTKNVGEAAIALANFVKWVASWLPGKEQFGPSLSPETDPRSLKDPNRPTPRKNEDLVTPVWRWSEEMARSFWEALKRLSAKSSETAISPMAYQPAATDLQRMFVLASYHSGVGGGSPGFSRAVYNPTMPRPANSNAPSPSFAPVPSGPPPAMFRQLESQYGLPPGLLDSVWSAESARGHRMVSSAGALGHFQFMPATARRFHVNDPFNLNQSATGASQYFNTLLREFGGDVAKAVASYNWGEGNVERDVRQWGPAWQQHIPRETQNYIQKVIGGLTKAGSPSYRQAAPRVDIQVHNNTGGNAIVTAAAMAVS